MYVVYVLRLNFDVLWGVLWERGDLSHLAGSLRLSYLDCIMCSKRLGVKRRKKRGNVGDGSLDDFVFLRHQPRGAEASGGGTVLTNNHYACTNRIVWFHTAFTDSAVLGPQVLCGRGECDSFLGIHTSSEPTPLGLAAHCPI